MSNISKDKYLDRSTHIMSTYDRVEEARLAREAFSKAMGKIRVQSIRKLLTLYYRTYAESDPSYRLRRDSLRKPRIMPGLNTVMSYFGCSKTCAMDYLYAIDVLENHIVKQRVEYLTRERETYNKPEDVWGKEYRQN